MNVFISKLSIVYLLFAQFSFSDNFYYKQNKKIKLIPESSSKVLNQIKYFKTENNVLLGITNKIILKLENDIVLDNYLKDFNLTKIKKLSKNIFLVEVKNNELTLEIANQLSQCKGIKYAHPDFIKKRILR